MDDHIGRLGVGGRIVVDLADHYRTQQHLVNGKAYLEANPIYSYSEIEYVSRMEDRQAIVYGNGKLREIRISEFHVGDDGNRRRN